ncbi:MAG: YbaK/EbsC family protein [archaeon]
MIRDFLEANKLEGRVFSFPSDTSIEKAAEEAHLSVDSIAKAFLFIDEKMDFFAVIALLGSKISSKEACSLFKKKFLEEADSEQILKFAGFEENFFPPVSVFGVRVVLHSSVKNRKSLLFALSNREFLLINTEDILKANADVEEILD